MRPPLYRVGGPAAAALVVALSPVPSLVSCSSLTEPPPPEPVSLEDAASPSATAAAAPTQSAPTPKPTASAPAAPAAPRADEKMTTTTLKPGRGAVAKAGDKVTVHYVGSFS